jgi:hypothetical protein
MIETADFLVRAFLIGMGATAVMDIWAAREVASRHYSAGLWSGGSLARLRGARALSPQSHCHVASRAGRASDQTAPLQKNFRFPKLPLAINWNWPKD